MSKKKFRNVAKLSGEEPVTERCGVVGESGGDIDFYVRTKDTSCLVAWIDKDGNLVLDNQDNMEDIGLVVGESGYPMVLLSGQREAIDVAALTSGHEQASPSDDVIAAAVQRGRDEMIREAADYLESTQYYSGAEKLRKKYNLHPSQAAPSDNAIAAAEQRGRKEAIREAVDYLRPMGFCLGAAILCTKFNIPESEAKPWTNP